MEGPGRNLTGHVAWAREFLSPGLNFLTVKWAHKDNLTTLMRLKEEKISHFSRPTPSFLICKMEPLSPL